MMLDIVAVGEDDIQLAVTEVSKAANVCRTQIGRLSFAPKFGVDQDYFINSEIRFPNQSYKAHLIQRLAESQVTVTSVIDEVETLMQKLNFRVGDTNADNGGLIA